MRVLSTIHMADQNITGKPPRRRQARRLREPSPPRTLPEFRQVNRHAGQEPLHPELSGLRLRKVDTAPQARGSLVHLRYRWQPSIEFHRRQREIPGINRWLTRYLRRPAMLPPILLFPNDQEVSPRRHQPLTELSDPTRDLHDLEKASRAVAPRTIQPRLTEVDPAYFGAYRHLLPRGYRRFLRASPYPRLVAGVMAALIITVAVLWQMRLREATAVAAGRLQVVRQVTGAEIVAARRYGVDNRWLLPLEARYRSLNTQAPGAGIVLTHSRLGVYQRQIHAYALLRHTLAEHERQAFRYWTWREGNAYAALIEANQYGGKPGVARALPPIPACATPRCFQRAIAQQSMERHHMVITGHR